MFNAEGGPAHSDHHSNMKTFMQNIKKMFHFDDDNDDDDDDDNYDDELFLWYG